LHQGWQCDAPAALLALLFAIPLASSSPEPARIRVWPCFLRRQYVSLSLPRYLHQSPSARPIREGHVGEEKTECKRRLWNPGTGRLVRGEP
jgi:hypothetical protein